MVFCHTIITDDKKHQYTLKITMFNMQYTNILCPIYIYMEMKRDVHTVPQAKFKFPIIIFSNLNIVA